MLSLRNLSRPRVYPNSRSSRSLSRSLFSLPPPLSLSLSLSVITTSSIIVITFALVFGPSYRIIIYFYPSFFHLSVKIYAPIANGKFFIISEGAESCATISSPLSLLPRITHAYASLIDRCCWTQTTSVDSKTFNSQSYNYNIRNIRHISVRLLCFANYT